jgi:hypothetical protein
VDYVLLAYFQQLKVWKKGELKRPFYASLKAQRVGAQFFRNLCPGTLCKGASLT